jgi:hypothetical protein
MAFIIENLNELAQWIVIIGLAGGVLRAWRAAKRQVNKFGDDIGM